MEVAPLGTGLRTTLLFVAVASITVTTWLWQLLSAGESIELPAAIAALVLPVAVGAIAGYYALHG